MADKAQAEAKGASASGTATTHEDGLIDFSFELEPQCLLQPHYADSSKIGYVVEGRALVGVLLPRETKERVVLIQEGDVITVPKETYTWWYNDGDCVFSIVFLGDAKEGLQPGLFTYFFLSGPAAVYNGFSSEFLSKACGISEEAAKKLFGSQSNGDIIKLEQKLTGIKPCEGDREGIVLNVKSARFSNYVECGGHAVSMTSDNLPFLQGLFRFSISFTKLEPNAMRLPGFFPAIQLVFVTKGSARVQITGINGATDKDEEVAKGSAFVVKKFFVMSAIAGSEGMEWCSIITSERPVFHPVVGKTSPLNLTHPRVLEACLNVSSELVNLVRENGASRDVIIPASD